VVRGAGAVGKGAMGLRAARGSRSARGRRRRGGRHRDVIGRPVFVAAFTVARGKVVALDILSDPDRHRLDFSPLRVGEHE
jgi:hypothetical protein